MKKVALLLALMSLPMLMVSGTVLVTSKDYAQAAATQDQGKIVFLSGRDQTSDNFLDIYTMNPDGSNVQRITNRPLHESDPVISPDGSKIAFSAYLLPEDIRGNETEIYTINTDGSGELTNLTNTPDMGEYGPTWSPDGEKIGFSTFGGTWDILTANADGTGEPVNLTNSSGSFEFEPSWSPDGSKIAFSADVFSDGRDDRDIFAVDADGAGTPANLTDTYDAEELSPDWSPDGSKIAYQRSPIFCDEDGCGSGAGDIYVMNADGSDQMPVVATFEHQFAPDWSLDGTEMVFSETSNAYGVEIFKVNASGTNVTRLTANTFVDNYASWGASAAIDTTAPKVVAVSPANVKMGVTRDTNLRAAFSEQMDPASITKLTFKLFRCPSATSTNCTTQITNVTLGKSTDGLRATLNPYGTSATKLSAKTKYKAVITTGAKDMAGNALDQDPTTTGNQQMAWYFTTGSM
jgi:Tol biopolymer transport system component